MRKNISERTDELAHRLRCSRRDLAGKIGISQAMLFAYRSGKSEPTLKFLRKLEAAETAAGIEAAPPVSRCTDTLKKGSNAESAGNPNEAEKGSDHFIESGKMMEDAAEYLAKPTVEGVFIRIAMALEEIARKLPDSGKG